MSGRASKQKGSRREREFAELTGGERVPLSGAMGTYTNDVTAYGMEWEVKSRKQGFKQLYDIVLDEREKPDAVALKVDRKPWLVCMTLEQFQKIMETKEKPKDD